MVAEDAIGGLGVEVKVAVGEDGASECVAAGGASSFESSVNC